MRKRIISLVLAFCIVISLLIIPASADDTTSVASSSTDELQGTWVFNDTIDFSNDFGASSFQATMNFTYSSAAVDLKYLRVYFDTSQIMYCVSASHPVTVYSVVSWADSSTGRPFNIIHISSTYDELSVSLGGLVDDEYKDLFLTWLKANATKQCTHDNTEIRNATDYYTGDSYCADCDKLLASGYNVISGWWQFNENIVAPLTAPLVENTSFTCCGSNYESFGWTGTDAGIYYDDVKVYDNITGWTNNIYRTVNLGDALVPVSEDFLTWFLANAVNLSYSDGVPLCIYDSDNSVLYPSFNVSYGSVLTVTDTGFTITDTSGNIESYPCAPGIAGITFLGLSSSPDQTSAEYPVGKQIVLTGATDLYVVLLELPIYAYLYSSDGQLLKILEALGDSTLTVNSNSLVLTGIDGVSDVYDLSLGADKTFLGLSLELNQNYSVNYSVGQSIPMSSSKNFYLVSEYPYPVAVYWNAGGVIKYFTGLNSCTVKVNDTSVDFISHDGIVETLDIPLSGDDAFWGLATSPSQKTPTYRPGSTITVYDAKNLFIVRRSDYNKLVEQDIVLEDDYGVSAEVTETEKNTLLTILNKIRSWFHTGAVVGDIIGVVDSGEMFIFFSDETAAEIDTVPAMFSWRDDPYDTSAYDEKFAILNQIYGGGE